MLRLEDDSTELLYLRSLSMHGENTKSYLCSVLRFTPKAFNYYIIFRRDHSLFVLPFIVIFTRFAF